MTSCDSLIEEHKKDDSHPCMNRQLIVLRGTDT